MAIDSLERPVISLDNNARSVIGGRAKAPVDSNFECRAIERIRPITEHYLATCLHHLFDTGVFDELERHADGISISSLATSLCLDQRRLTGLFYFLANEGVVTLSCDTVALTTKGKEFGEFRAWYTMMIGGYSTTIHQIGRALSDGAPYCGRDGHYVGPGSCEMSRFDGLPITETLLSRSNLSCRSVLDLGCGNGLYLVELCKHMPNVVAWGVEPDHGSYQKAHELIRSAGMEERITLFHMSTDEFFDRTPDQCRPDLLIFGFVLHEILAQEGRRAVVDLLIAVFDRFPDINLIVIEVLDQMNDPASMNHSYARNFWNPYMLIHYFTEQKLEKKEFWDRLFMDCGAQVVDLITTDHRVDSSNLELGYLLRKRFQT